MEVGENPRLMFKDGVRYFINGDLNNPELKSRMNKARNHLAEAKRHNSFGLEELYIEVPNGYTAESRFGVDTIRISMPEVGEKKKLLFEKTRTEDFELISEETVLAHEVWLSEGELYTDLKWQIGYMLCMGGNWKPPYEFLETENVIHPVPTLTEYATARASGVTVYPFCFNEWKWWSRLDDNFPDPPWDLESEADEDGNMLEVLIETEYIPYPDGSVEKIDYIDIPCKMNEVVQFDDYFTDSIAEYVHNHTQGGVYLWWEHYDGPQCITGYAARDPITVNCTQTHSLRHAYCTLEGIESYDFENMGKIPGTEVGPNWAWGTWEKEYQQSPGFAVDIPWHYYDGNPPCELGWVEGYDYALNWYNSHYPENAYDYPFDEMGDPPGDPWDGWWRHSQTATTGWPTNGRTCAATSYNHGWIIDYFYDVPNSNIGLYKDSNHFAFYYEYVYGYWLGTTGGAETEYYNWEQGININGENFILLHKDNDSYEPVVKTDDHPEELADEVFLKHFEEEKLCAVVVQRFKLEPDELVMWLATVRPDGEGLEFDDIWPMGEYGSYGDPDDDYWGGPGQSGTFYQIPDPADPTGETILMHENTLEDPPIERPMLTPGHFRLIKIKKYRKPASIRITEQTEIEL